MYFQSPVRPCDTYMYASMCVNIFFKCPYILLIFSYLELAKRINLAYFLFFFQILFCFRFTYFICKVIVVHILINKLIKTLFYSGIFTARNEVGARLYFHRRLWFCPQGEACMVAGGMHGCQGVCVVARGVHGCQGVCVHGFWGVCVVVRGCAWLLGGAWLLGACIVAGGHAWLLGACVVAGGWAWLPGGMRGCWGLCIVVGGVWLLGGHVWLPGGVHGCQGVHGLWGTCVVVGGMHRAQRDTINERAVRILLECILVLLLLLPVS